MNIDLAIFFIRKKNSENKNPNKILFDDVF